MQTEADATPTVDDSSAAITVEYRASDDGVETRGLLAGAFEFPFIDGYAPLFMVNLVQTSDTAPEQMRLAGLLPFLVPVETTLAESEATQPAAAEVQAVKEEGTSTSTSTSATPEGVEASAQASAGNQEVSQEAAAAVPDEETLRLGGSSGAWTPSEEASQEAVVAPEPEPAAEESYAQPAALYAASDAVMPAQGEIPELVATGVAVATMTTSGLVFFPGARQVAFRWLRRIIGLGLFSRIAQEDILSHGRRAELFEFIKQNPGERIENARRALSISNGSMHYHLKVLSERNLIRILRDGGLARLYPAGPKINPQPYVPAQRRRFVDLLSSRPGVTQREAATLLGISERMASYHIQTLSTQGLVEVRPEGARKRLFLRMETAPVPTQVAA
ncbi:MAG TPA: hypothetical protein VGB18_05820 [Candidatus Thermoplasmatota archaeon]